MSKLKTIPESECSCLTCQEMCHRPCWGTPQDIEKIIDAGFGERLMLDYYYDLDVDADGGVDIENLCPALKGFEKKRAPFVPRDEKGCTFFKEGKCELHDLKLKPTEGKLAYCKPILSRDDEMSIHEEIGRTWDSDEGREIINKFKSKHKF